jgi:hypothetical protein
MEQQQQQEQQQQEKLFTADEPPPDFLEVLDRTGCFVFPGILTPHGARQIVDEMYATKQAQTWQAGAGETGSDTLNIRADNMLVRGPVDEDAAAGVSLWPAPGSACFSLIDSPVVIKCLELAVPSKQFHYCHGAFGFRRPGTGGIAFHQDHHHWKHENPVNLAGRATRYIQLLWCELQPPCLHDAYTYYLVA